jgi:hypothetical protein
VSQQLALIPAMVAAAAAAAAADEWGLERTVALCNPAPQPQRHQTPPVQARASSLLALGRIPWPHRAGVVRVNNTSLE